jgi:4-diphosphocytidyl-2-C-methyl-D-erythritol kinase
LRLVAPAKVNFGLRVVGRRPDGFHALESLFLPLDLADELDLSLSDAGAAQVQLELGGDADGVPAGAGNLAVRAAQGFLEVAGLRRRVALRLAKRIPAAAGLGGGSSDAGAVLRGLASALPGAVPAEGLRALALALGADVPFFLEPTPSFVSGVGERCEPLPGGWPRHTLVLANPGAPLETRRVFQLYDALTPQPSAPTLRALLPAARAEPPDAGGLAALLVNDLEPAALRLCPAIGELREALGRAGALAVGLSGSGATVFGVFRSEEEAQRAARGFRPPVWARVARTRESG